MCVSTLEWLLHVFLPALLLIVGPPVVGSVLSYVTPPIGFGCTSLTFICYAGSQAVLAFNTAWVHFTGRNQTTLGLHVLNTFKYIAYGVSVLTVIVGTLLKGFGVYSNCFCSRPAKDWFNPAAVVLVTWDVRDLERSLNIWYFSGAAFCILLAILSVAGWFYQEHVQSLLKETIQGLPDDDNAMLDMNHTQELEVKNRQSNSEQPEAVMPEIVPGPSSANLPLARGPNSTSEHRKTSSTDQLLMKADRSGSEMTSALSSAEEIDTGQLRFRPLRSTKTFPGGRDGYSY
jgi:hypothetical protein